MPDARTDYLVIGTAINETITHQESRRTRRDVGAVAGQMATALARHHCPVTLLSSTPNGPVAHQTLHMLTEAGVNVHTVPGRHPPGWANITTRRGQQVSARGKWPPPDSAIDKHIPELVESARWLLLECNITDITAEAAMASALRAGVPVTINATTRARASLIWRTRLRFHKALVTMNSQEAQALLATARADGPDQLRAAINTKDLLITSGPAGWTLYRRDDPDVTSPAPPVPRNTDYVGCGDYATSGLTHALADGLDIKDTVNRFISTRVSINTL